MKLTMLDWSKLNVVASDTSMDSVESTNNDVESLLHKYKVVFKDGLMI